MNIKPPHKVKSSSSLHRFLKTNPQKPAAQDHGREAAESMSPSRLRLPVTLRMSDVHRVLGSVALSPWRLSVRLLLRTRPLPCLGPLFSSAARPRHGCPCQSTPRPPDLPEAARPRVCRSRSSCTPGSHCSGAAGSSLRRSRVSVCSPPHHTQSG